MAAQAKDEWEKAMSELAQEEPELLQHFQKLSEAAGKVGKACRLHCLWFWDTPLPTVLILNVVRAFVIGTDTASQQEFTSCLKDTLRGLAKNADNLQVGQICFKPVQRDEAMPPTGTFPLQSSGLAGDDLVKALEGLGLEEGNDGGCDDGNILPIMQSIMQNLLSKEVLYPSLKEITTKVCISLTSNLSLSSSTPSCHSWLSPPPQYPEWLEANKSSLSPEDRQRYEQQAKIMGEICAHFEREDQDPADKESTFENIMELMQKVDRCC